MKLIDRLLELTNQGYHIDFFRHPKSTMVIKVRREGESGSKNKHWLKFEYILNVNDPESIVIESLNLLVANLDTK